MLALKRRVMAKTEIVYKGKPYTLAYEILNFSQPSTIVFLHGWGSNKELMKQSFGSFFPTYKHLYIDLPGFGASSVHDILNTEDYTSIIKTFLIALQIEPYAIVGHSFGGKVATLLAPYKLVLLSSAGIVIPKSLSVKLKIAFFKCFKSFVPKQWYRFFATKDVAGMSQTMYEILKKVVNEDMRQQFLTCKAQSFIFWGTKDSATPLESGKTIASLIPSNHFFPIDGDHFFFIHNGAKIEKLLLESGF